MSDRPSLPAMPRPLFRRWFGSSTFIAVTIFLAGRLLLEPLRTVPQFDEKGMEAFKAVETYGLHRNPHSPKVILLGSSITQWAIAPHLLPDGLGVAPELVCNLCAPGATPFDMRCMAADNPERLRDVRLALVEMNPFILKQGLETDHRVRAAISQRGTLAQRLMISDSGERAVQVAEWVLPVFSVRRSLRSAFLYIADPDPGWPVYPHADSRMYPLLGWYVNARPDVSHHSPHLENAKLIAQRIIGGWRLSKLQDESMRALLNWLSERNIAIIFHQPPFDPDVIRIIHETPAYDKAYRRYLEYVASLQTAALASFCEWDASKLGISREMLYDRTHLNETGAELYTKRLAADIRRVFQP